MAAVIFANRSRRTRVREQFDTALSVCREWLDAFVSSRMRHAVAEVENVRPGNTSIELVRNEKQDL